MREFELNKNHQNRPIRDELKDKNYKGHSKLSLRMEFYANVTPNECLCHWSIYIGMCVLI